MGAELLVLGSEPAWPSGARACSGYLLRTEEMALLIDCGTSVYGRLREVMPPERLTGIVLSHLHFDHWADLIPLRYYLRYEASADTAPQLYLPPGGTELLRRVVTPVDDDPEFFTGVFPISEYDPSAVLRLTGWNVTFHRTRHPIASHALRLESGHGVLTFSADTGWEPSLGAFAQDSDLFLCEAAWGAGPSQGESHLTAEEAGRLAESAHARQLLLTHLPLPQAEESLRAARATFSGHVEHAREGLSFPLRS